jgi:hypothetical protein
MITAQSKDTVTTFLDADYVKAKIAELEERVGVEVREPDWDCGQTRCARTGIQVLNLTTGAVTSSWSTHGGIGEVDNLLGERQIAGVRVGSPDSKGGPDPLSAHNPQVQALPGAATVRRTCSIVALSVPHQSPPTAADSSTGLSL